MKFSFIIPVYNTEHYLKKCLDSIVNQTYKNFEIIVVNDGSPDNSQQIIQKYTDKYSFIKGYIKKNNGLSSARNFGVKKATGDYLIFVDSDDYIEKDLLKNINQNLENVDILKYQVKKIINESVEKIDGITFDKVEPKYIFEKLAASSLFEPAWLYAINRKFYLKNNFKFADKKLHEDLGLIPYIIIKAKTIKSIDYIGYNYVIRENSIITNQTIENNLKKFNDVLYHYDNLIGLIENENMDLKTKNIFKSFLANEVILKAQTLDKTNYKYGINEIKKRKVLSNLLSNNIKRLGKKIYLKLMFKYHIKKSMKGN